MLANPRLIAWLSVQRMLSFMSPFTVSDAGGLKAILTGLFIYVPILLLALWGFVRWRREPGAQVAFSFFLAYLLAHTLAHGGLRYRLPVDPMLIYLAATALRRKA
jgi:hypothetical protein